LKIVHLTTHTSGGAGNFAMNVFKASLKLNESKNYLYSIDTLKVNLFSKIYASILYRFQDKIYQLASYFNLLKYHHFFFGLYPTSIFKGRIKKKLVDVDIFLIYWVSKFLKAKDFKELKKNNPNAKFIFLNTDEAHFTGGCHYKFDCKQNDNLCFCCPGMNLTVLKNKVSKEFSSKIDLYEEINPLFILPSSTFKKDFKNSILLDRYNNKVIPFGAYFENQLNQFIKERELYLFKNRNKINILIRSSTEPRKGCQLFIETIKKLSNDNSPLLDRMVLHIIGDNYLIKSGISELMHTQFYGFVNKKRLFELYAESDVFIVTSEQDSGPIMINECIGLGLYVLSTKVGVASDLILSKNGVIYDRNTKSLIEALKNLNLDRIREFAREHLNSEDLYDLSFEKFYKEIINNIP
jgi:hypothetical protein